jgi:hypothetical protein
MNKPKEELTTLAAELERKFMQHVIERRAQIEEEMKVREAALALIAGQGKYIMFDRVDWEGMKSSFERAKESEAKLLKISEILSERHGDDGRFEGPEDEYNDDPEVITIKRIFAIIVGDVTPGEVHGPGGLMRETKHQRISTRKSE